MHKYYARIAHPTRIAIALALAFGSVGTQAGVTVDSVTATGSYSLNSGAAVNLSQSNAVGVDVVAFPYSGSHNAVLHSYGYATGDFGSRSSGYGVYDVSGSFRISETITNSTGSAQRATFNFYITPGFINNQIGSALSGSNYVSSGLVFDIRKDGSTIWGSSATLTSDSSGTAYSATGDTTLYAGGGTYYSISGGSRSVDLGVINAGESITLSYELSSFARGVSSVGEPYYVPGVTYHVPDQWVDFCGGDCGYGEGYGGEFIAAHDVVVEGYWAQDSMSGSHAGSGDPFDINWDGTAYDYGAHPFGSPLYGSSVEFTPAVPEPSEYALLLAGLGLMGWTARRRRMRGSV